MAATPGDKHQAENDPGIAEDDILSMMMIWSYELAHQLSSVAENEGQVSIAFELMKIARTYSRTAYLAGRMRVDCITLNLVNKPVIEMCTRQTRVNMETVRVLPKACE